MTFSDALRRAALMGGLLLPLTFLQAQYGIVYFPDSSYQFGRITLHSGPEYIFQPEDVDTAFQLTPVNVTSFALEKEGKPGQYEQAFLSLAADGHTQSFFVRHSPKLKNLYRRLSDQAFFLRGFAGDLARIPEAAEERIAVYQSLLKEAPRLSNPLMYRFRDRRIAQFAEYLSEPVPKYPTTYWLAKVQYGSWQVQQPGLFDVSLNPDSRYLVKYWAGELVRNTPLSGSGKYNVDLGIGWLSARLREQEEVEEDVWVYSSRANYLTFSAHLRRSFFWRSFYPYLGIGGAYQLLLEEDGRVVHFSEAGGDYFSNLDRLTTFDSNLVFPSVQLGGELPLGSRRYMLVELTAGKNWNQQAAAQGIFYQLSFGFNLF
jgi:hypothetical protein